MGDSDELANDFMSRVHIREDYQGGQPLYGFEESKAVPPQHQIR